MKKRALTLLEIMIVIFLITLITGTIGYSMRGSMDKGRAFRTEQAKEQLHDLLLISLSEGHRAEEIAQKPLDYLKKQGLAKDPEQLLLDGWKQPFKITAQQGGHDFNIVSESWNLYKNRVNRTTANASSQPEEE